MRPVSHHPLSVRETKCSPPGATRIAENPPNAEWEDFSSSPPRYSTIPKRRWSGARALKAAIGLASTMIGSGGSTPIRWASAGNVIATAAQATIANIERRERIPIMLAIYPRVMAGLVVPAIHGLLA